MISKTFYFLESLTHLILRRNLDCPNCRSQSRVVIDRKYFITSLRRCPTCQLLHRIPRDSDGRGKAFYQVAYRQGFTTDMPNSRTLRLLLAKKFRGGPRDYRAYLELLASLGLKKMDSILEYGCSWGYGAWQLQDAGYKVEAFEISKLRCRYAREQLGIRAFDDPESVKGNYSAVFSAHVLEHVDELEVALARQWGWLKPGGLLVGVTPNGSKVFQQTHPKNYHNLWGKVHPQLLDEVYLRKRFSEFDLQISSISGDQRLETNYHNWNKNHSLDKWELVFAVRKPSA